MGTIAVNSSVSCLQQSVIGRANRIRIDSLPLSSRLNIRPLKKLPSGSTAAHTFSA